MQKIKNIQFPLLYTAEGSAALSEFDIDPSKVEHQCCFKAQLFRPHGDINYHIGNFNKDCLAGYWLRLDDFCSSEFDSYQYYMPTKSEWVTKPHDQVEWQSHLEITDDIRSRLLNGNAPLIWLKRNDLDMDKIFVVGE